MAKLYKFSQRSEENLRGVNPDLIKVIRRALEITERDFSIIEGRRTKARQRQLVLNGKSKTMNSKHLTGDAVDLLPVGADWSQYTDWLPVLKAVYKAGRELKIRLRFGISWTDCPTDPTAKFLDAPHVEILS